MRTLLQRSLSTVPRAVEPDWTGFWPAILRAIEDARQTAPPRAAGRDWLQFRLALGGALVGAFLVASTIWQAPQVPPVLDAPVIVRSADTEHPQGSVMVYHTPEQDMTVVWVFGLTDD